MMLLLSLKPSYIFKSLWLIALCCYALNVFAVNGEYGAPQASRAGLSLPGAVSYDAYSNRLLVVETGQHRIAYQTLPDIFTGADWHYFAESTERDVPEALNEPQGIAVDSAGNVYVADTFNNQVKLYRYDSSNGNYSLDSRFTHETRTVVDNIAIDRPRDISIAGDGTVYLLDSGNRRILSATGPDAQRWVVHHVSTDWLDPRGLTVAADGSLYIADTGGHRIVHLQTDGSLDSFGHYGRGRGKLRFPHDVALDSSGRIYVADTHNQRIVVFDSQGNYFRSLGAAPLLKNPEKIFVDNDGRVFVADMERDDIIAFLGPDFPARYDGYIRTSPLDDGSEPFSDADNRLSPDILVRSRADLDVAAAAIDGFVAYGSDAVIPGNQYFVYLMLNNGGQQPLPPGVLKLYSSEIDTVEPLYQFPEEWSANNFYRFNPGGSGRIASNTLRLPEIPGTVLGAGPSELDHHRVAVGPLVWQPEGNVTGCDSELLLMARHVNLYDSTAHAEGLEQVALSNNVAVKSVPFVEASCIPSPDRYESNDRLPDAVTVNETWVHLHERCPLSEVRGSGRSYPDTICADPFENRTRSLHAEEIWTMEIANLSLHSRTDEDFLLIPLPKLSDPIYQLDDINTVEIRERFGHHDTYEPQVMPECGAVLRKAFGPEGISRDAYVNVSTELVIQIIAEEPPESSVAPRGLQVAGESLSIYADGERNPSYVRGSRLIKRLHCPQSRHDLNAIAISLGEYIDGSDDRPRLRDVLATGGYKVSLSYISSIDWQTPRFVDEFEGTPRLGCIGTGRFNGGPGLPSLGMGSSSFNFIPQFHFPFCADFGRFGFFDQFPIDPGRNCLADGPGCWDFSRFQWPETETLFDLFLIGTEPLELALISSDGKPIESRVLGTQFSPQQLRELTSIDLEEFSLPGTSDIKLYSTRMQISSLSAGNYGLSIKGNPGKYAISMLTPVVVVDNNETQPTEPEISSDNKTFFLLTFIVLIVAVILLSFMFARAR